MTVGELAAYIDADDSGFQRTTQNVERRMERLTGDIEQELRDSERDFDRWAQEVGDAGREAARDLERQVERGLDEVADSAREAGQEAGDNLAEGMDGAGGAQMGGLSERWAGLMQKAGPWLAAGAAIGGVLLKSITDAMEREDVAAKLSAQVGAFGQRSRELGDTAGQLYAAGYGESMADIGEALRGVIQNMGGMRDASTKDLKEIAAGAMNVADILGEDVSKVTRTVGQMIRTGMAKDAQAAFDLLVSGTQRGANAAEDLLDTFDEYSTQFRSMGLDGQKAMGLLVQGLRGGARDADVVADAVKEFSIEAVKGGDGVVKGFKSLGLNADQLVKTFAKGGPGAAKAFDAVLDKLRNVEDPVKRNQIAFSLLGTKSEDLAAALLTLDPSKAVMALGQVDGAAKKAGDTLHDTASNRIETFKRGLQTGLVDFVGGPVLGSLESFATRAQAAIQGWINQNPQVVEQFRSAWTQVGEIFRGVADIVTAVWAKIGPTIMTGVKILAQTIGGVLSGLLGIIKGVVNVVAGILTGDWSRAWKGMQGIVKGAVKVVLSVARGLIKSFVAIIAGAGKLLLSAGKAIMQGLWNGIKGAAGWVKDKVGALIKDIIPGPVRKALGIASPSKEMRKIGRYVMDGLWLGLKDKEADKVKKEMRKLGSELLRELGRGVHDSDADQIKTTMGQVADKIRKAFEKVAGKTRLDDRLLALTKRTTKRLAALAKERAKVMEKLADMRQFRDSVKNSVRGFAGLTSIDFGEEGPTSKGIRAGLQDKVKQLREWAKNIRILMKRKLPKSLLRQIFEAGPEQGGELAAALVAGGTNDLGAITAAQKEIDSLTNSLGSLGMDAVFGKGVYEGLLKEQKRIEALMDRIARQFAKQIARALGVKGGGMVGTSPPSPSQQLGELRIVLDGKGAMRGFRREIRVSGGSVQKVLGK